MGAKIQTTLRIDKEKFSKAKEILAKCGLNFSQAVNVFVSMIVQNKGLPFEVKIPNEETVKVIKEARKGQNLKDTSLQELEKKINA